MMIENKYSTKVYWFSVDKKRVDSINIQRRTARIVKKMAELCSIDKNTTILDIGCGHGNYTYQFLKFTKKITGIDHCSYARTNPCKKIIIISADKLPFKDKSFDVVLVLNTFHHMEEITKVISEIKRISRKYIVIYESNPRNILTKLMAFLRPEERLVIKRPLYMNRIINYFQEYKVIYKTFVISFLFTNVFSDFIMNFLPEPKFSGTNILSNILSVEYFVVFKCD